MPKLEAKTVQKELESGKVWPVYWIYGPERMKSRELLKRIRKAVLGAEAESGSLSSFLEDHLDGAETGAAQVVDSARSLSLGGGTRLLIVREAQLIKDPEPMAELLGPPGPVNELASVVVFLAKDLDGRRKFSKLLTEKAAVIDCAEIAEDERDAWIGYLAKRRGVEVSAPMIPRLRSLDPWSLDIVDLELEKIELGGIENSDEIGTGVVAGEANEVFFDAFFGRDEKRALEIAGQFADHPDQSLPLLGLLAWNVRYLALTVADREKGTRSAKLSPFLADRFKRWSRHWKLEEVALLQSRLQELDFSVKQTPRLPLGLWGELVMEFCGGR